MIYLFENVGNSASIVFEEDTLTLDERARGIAIESLPLEEKKEGKQAVLKCRKTTNEVWYEYEDIPKKEKDITQERLSSLEIAIANMMGV